jgi:hypothetical protein
LTDPFEMAPGSKAARGRGCICDPQKGEWNPETKKTVYQVEMACPVHGIAELRVRGGTVTKDEGK